MSDTENTLSHLIDVCEDARVFYKEATAQTKDPEMKRLFTQMMNIRFGIIMDLREYMRNHDMQPENPDETFKGKINKFLGENIAKISDNTDEALITYLEEAEDNCLHSFKDAANDNDLSVEARALLNEELSVLKKTHDYMRDLKKAVARANAA